MPDECPDCEIALVSGVCRQCGWILPRPKVVIRYPDRVETVGEPSAPPLTWEQNAGAAKILARVLDKKLTVEDALDQMRALFGP